MLGHGPAEPELLDVVRALLDEDDPCGLLSTASALLAALEPERSPFAEDPGEPSTADLLLSFIEVDRVETTALLTVLVELVDDDLMVRRIRRELGRRGHRLPGWLRSLTPLQATGTHEVTHVLGDSSDLVVGVRTAAGGDLTAVVHLDHHAGSIPSDGFVHPGPTAEVLEHFSGEADLDVAARDPAAVRARLEEAVRHGRMTWPPVETDTWPAARALVEWITRHLPDGGAAPGPRLWSQDERDELAEEFLRSPLGSGHDHADGRDLLDSLLWYACDYGPDDPLLWSPLRVEILLVDWLPRKVVAPASYLAGAPVVLRDLIRWSHRERGLRDELTDRALTAVDEFEPEYQRLIRSDRPQGPAALLAAMGVGDGAEADAPWDDERETGLSWPTDLGEDDLQTILRDVAVRQLADLRETVGGADALAALTDEPLPDEPVDWTGIPNDVHAQVAEVAAWTDRCATDLFDVEFRTACHRLVADVARTDPEVFRRRGRIDTAAAAIAWIIGKTNDVFDSYGDGPSIGDLVDWFGVSSNPAQRARTMLRALGAENTTGGVLLGDPRYLTAARRRRLVGRRDELAAQLDDHDPADVHPGHDESPIVRPPTPSTPRPSGVRASDDVGAALDLGVDPAPATPWTDRHSPDVAAVGWFPRDQFPSALSAFDSLAERVGAAGPDGYARLVQGTLLDLARDLGRQPELAPMTVASLTAFADEHGIDPDSSTARAAHAAALEGSGDVLPWPPGRNDPCWCGSGRKYKKCCDTVPVDPDRRKRPAPRAAAYVFDVTLMGTEPPVWRRFRLDATGTFGDLHQAIQTACGWTNSHLFVFTSPDGTAIAGSAFDSGWGEPEPDAARVPLASWFTTHDRIDYEYDFGDSWHHRVVLHQRIADDDAEGRRLVDGARAFPPEDCGGIPGYEQCVRVARGGDDPDDLAAWLGDWDPDRFHIEAVRRRFDR